MYCPFRDCLCIPAATSLCCNSECLQKCLQLRWIASTGLIWSSASSEERIGHRETRACFAIPSHGNLSFWLWVDDVQVESLVREVGGHALVSEGLLTRGQRPWRGIWRGLLTASVASALRGGGGLRVRGAAGGGAGPAGCWAPWLEVVASSNKQCHLLGGAGKMPCGQPWTSFWAVGVLVCLCWFACLLR